MKSKLVLALSAIVSLLLTGCVTHADFDALNARVGALEHNQSYSEIQAGEAEFYIVDGVIVGGAYNNATGSNGGKVIGFTRPFKAIPRVILGTRVKTALFDYNHHATTGEPLTVQLIGKVETSQFEVKVSGTGVLTWCALVP